MFDGGKLTSDRGVLLLAWAERAIGFAGRLAGCIADSREQSRAVHGIAHILQARILAIACGYEDAEDCNRLRHDPGFKLAAGKLKLSVEGGPALPLSGSAGTTPTSDMKNPPHDREADLFSLPIA